MKVKKSVRIGLYLLVLLIIILYAYPLLYVLSTALKSQAEYWRDPIGLVKEIHLDNFVDAWKMANLGSAIKNSLFYTFVCTIVSVILAIFLSYPIARNYYRCFSVIYLLFMIGMFLPDPTIPRWQMIFNSGLYNTRLGYMLTLLGGGGVTLMMFVSYIKSIPKEMDEAAVMDGCGYIHFVFRILVPLMKPAIVSMALLKSITMWNDVMNALLYLTDKELYPITRCLYVFTGVYSSNVPLLSAALVLIAVPMIILYILLQRQIVDGIMVGSVKA